jgi:CBS domain-containing protein
MKVSGVMTPDVITVREDTAVDEIAWLLRDADDDIGQAATLMLKHKLTCLPALREGNLGGIVSRADIPRLLARSE